MKQDKDGLKFSPIKFGKHPELDFSESPKIRPQKKQKRRKFWSPFSDNGGKSKRSGSRFYRRQMRKVKRDMSL